jgi:hypothetical protein
MFGLISAGVSLAGLGMSAYEAIKANRDMKKAQADANQALTQYQNITRPNAFAALQAPDVSSLAFDRNQRMMAQGAETLAQTGAEGSIGGVANMLQAGQEANLQAAQEQAKINYEKEFAVKSEEANINKDIMDIQKEVIGVKASNAMSQYNQAVDARTAAVQGILGGLGNAIGFAKTDFSPDTGKYDGGAWYANNQNTQS